MRQLAKCECTRWLNSLRPNGDILRNDCSVILLDIHGDLAKDVTRLVKDKERVYLDHNVFVSFKDIVFALIYCSND